MKDKAIEKEEKRIAEACSQHRAEIEANNYKIVPIHRVDSVLIEKLQQMGFKVCDITGGEVGNRKAFYFAGPKEEIEKAVAEIRKQGISSKEDPLSSDVELEQGKAEIDKDGKFTWKEQPKEKVDGRTKTPEERAAWGQKMKEAREKKRLAKA